MTTPNNKNREDNFAKLMEKVMEFSVQYFAMSPQNPVRNPVQLQKALIMKQVSQKA